MPSTSAVPDQCSRLFAGFLADRNLIPAPEPGPGAECREHLDAFLRSLGQHRGLSDRTIELYEGHVRKLLPALGDETEAYDAARIRNTVLARLDSASRTQVRDEASALRMYLGFLGSNGLIRPQLAHAVPSIPAQRGERLPRHVGQDDIERMIASCDLATPVGIRDRRCCCSWPGWHCGPVMSPGFGSSIVSRAIRRAGIRGVGPASSHLFRHSAATNLLRDGAPLEAISSLLRHSSLDTTAIYARVDVRMLRKLVQPWPFAGDVR